MSESKPPNRIRHRQIKFWVNDEEYDLIQEKMKIFGTRLMGAYLRKMAIDGYIIKLELPELKETTQLLGILSNNVNQMAKIANSGGRIYKQEIKEVQQQLEQVFTLLRKIYLQLSQIPVSRRST